MDEEPRARFTRSRVRGDSGSILTPIGAVLLLVGLYFLLFPGSPVDTSALGALGSLAPTEVVNLQKLAIGMTASVVGAIFLAAGLTR